MDGLGWDWMGWGGIGLNADQSRCHWQEHGQEDQAMGYEGHLPQPQASSRRRCVLSSQPQPYPPPQRACVVIKLTVCRRGRPRRDVRVSRRAPRYRRYHLDELSLDARDSRSPLRRRVCKDERRRLHRQHRESKSTTHAIKAWTALRHAGSGDRRARADPRARVGQGRSSGTRRAHHRAVSGLTPIQQPEGHCPAAPRSVHKGHDPPRGARGLCECQAIVSTRRKAGPASPSRHCFSADANNQLGDWRTSQPRQPTRQDLALSGDETTWFPLRILDLCRDRLHEYAHKMIVQRYHRSHSTTIDKTTGQTFRRNVQRQAQIKSEI